MGLSTLRYYFQEAFTSIIRNGWLSLASIGTVAVSLFVLGCSLLLVLNINKFVDELESMLEISVFLEKNLKDEHIRELGEKIRFLSGVTDVEFIPKEKALEIMKSNMGEDKLKDLDYNPLPDAFRVKTYKARQVPEIAEEISKFAGVEKVRYGQGMIEKLLTVTHWVRVAGLVAIIILGIAAVFLISTTIRISVFSRRKEIGIMKYLGATNWFVRLPFLLEGTVLGLTGAFLATAIVYYSYLMMIQKINVVMPFVPVIAQIKELLPVFTGLLGLGFIIGITGSAISIHRFLKV